MILFHFVSVLGTLRVKWWEKLVNLITLHLKILGRRHFNLYFQSSELETELKQPCTWDSMPSYITVASCQVLSYPSLSGINKYSASQIFFPGH